LVEKDTIQKSLIDRNDKYHELESAHQDFKATLEILSASSEGREEGHKESLDEHITKLQARVESYREKGAKRQEVQEEIGDYPSPTTSISSQGMFRLKTNF